MNNVVFAANKSHALAMIHWLKLEPNLWHANLYGGRMKTTYDRAILVRPVDGVTHDHFVWISTVLAPLMTSIERITVMHWRYDEFNEAVTDDFTPEMVCWT